MIRVRQSPVDPLTAAAIVVAVLAVSSSGPLIVFAAAPALAIAFWRNALAVGVLAPVALTRRRAELAALTREPGRRDGMFIALSGLALAVHFGAWISSVKLTTVAAAVALGATQPVWQGLIAWGQGRRPSPLTWLGISFAVVGAALATGADFGVSTRAVAGDLLAVAGGLAVAIYTAFGERARASISTTAYTTVCYAACALALLAACVLAGVPLTGFDSATWLAIAALVAGAQLLGHSMFNYALHKVSATTISVLILLEVPGAALLAWVWLGQTPRPGALPGLALLLAGVAVVILGGTRRLRADPSTPTGALDLGGSRNAERSDSVQET
ncbi:MAG TPA: DMT family transporter [Micromonosporaceae bacterium]|jgi:drug/metabolite transporter (DMT)-like permease|nr:DMT family transporter [Micromonosporaceae bacterium]